MKISSWNTSEILQEDLDDIENILANFCNHPSILKIKNNFGGRSFSFRKFQIVHVRKHVLRVEIFQTGSYKVLLTHYFLASNNM